MNEVHVIGHIFGQLENQDNAIRHIFKALKKMQKLDKRFAIWSCMVSFWLIHLDHKAVETDRKINILYKKIKKLEEENEKKTQEE